MQFINKQQHVPSRFHFIYHFFNTVFKFPAVFGFCNESGHVQRYQTFICHNIRYVSVYQTLCNSFNDRCLTDTRLSDQTRIIFASAAQNLDHPFGFLFPANYRV